MARAHASGMQPLHERADTDSPSVSRLAIRGVEVAASCDSHRDAHRDTHPCSTMPCDARHRQSAARWSPKRAVPRLLDVSFTSTLVLASLFASDPCSPCVKTYDEYASPELVPPAQPAPVVPEGPKWERTGYGLFGVAPMSVMRSDSFSPGLRYDFETGFAFTRKRMRFSVGPDFHLVQYFGRKKPALGLDAMVTGSWGPIYVRGGLGVMTGLAATRNLNDMRPGVGGVVGIGLQTLRDHVGGRVGVDYDFRMDTAGRPVQTVMISLRLFFG